MIPKIIHYCWFGNNPLPQIAIECINSWKKYCHDFEIIEWNNSNYNININTYMKDAVKLEKWAFVSDIARLDIVHKYGGIYLDIDVEIIKPIEKFLNDSMFIGFENSKQVATGLGFGAEKNHWLIKEMLNVYNESIFENSDGTLNTTPCSEYNTKVLFANNFSMNNSLQNINNVTIYPTEYFCPKNWETGEINITNNTYLIHHYNASWWSEESKKEHEYKKAINSLLKRSRLIKGENG